MSERVGIAIVGLPGAGKSTVGDILTDKLHGIGIETGDVVRDGATDHYDVNSADELTSDQLGEYSTMRRREDGGDYVARDVVEQLDEDDRFPSQFAIIVGMRDTEVPQFFDEYFDIFHTVWVHAPFDVRLERLQSRGRNGEDEFTEDDLKYRDGRESMWGTPECALQSEVQIMNDGTVEELREMLDELCEQMWVTMR